MIFNKYSDHLAQLHKPENPTRDNHEIDGFHCHIKVNRENLFDFLGRVFIRHNLDTTDAALHKNNFYIRCLHLEKTPVSRGLPLKMEVLHKTPNIKI